MLRQKAPSAIRCIKTFQPSIRLLQLHQSQKAPSAIRCIKTCMAVQTSITMVKVRKHLAS